MPEGLVGLIYLLPLNISHDGRTMAITLRTAVLTPDEQAAVIECMESIDKAPL